MDRVLKQKKQLEHLLGRRIRGTITYFIQEWNRISPQERALLVNQASTRLTEILEGYHKRTNVYYKSGKGRSIYAPDDASFIMGRVVDKLIASEGDGTRKKDFILKIRKWATGAARRISQRDAESARFENAKRNVKGAVYKVWTSRLDGLERPDHLDAHLRYAARPIPINQPFIIGKRRFQMMHPGDVSFGAPPDQFMNCRCSVSYFDGNGKRIR